MFSFDFDHSSATTTEITSKGLEFFATCNGWDTRLGLELEFQTQIGSKMFPEYLVRSMAHAFYELVNNELLE